MSDRKVSERQASRGKEVLLGGEVGSIVDDAIGRDRGFLLIALKEKKMVERKMSQTIAGGFRGRMHERRARGCWSLV